MNIENDCFDFGSALEHLKSGMCVRRNSWEDGTFLFLVPGSKFGISKEPLMSIYHEGVEVTYKPHIDMAVRYVNMQAWSCTQDDILADDWLQGK